MPRKSAEFTVPDGLTELLNDFTTAVLKSQPRNLHKFAKEYFDNKFAQRSDEEESAAPPPGDYNKGRRKSVAAERYDPSNDDKEESKMYPKTDEQRQKLSAAVPAIFIFKTLDSEQIPLVIGAMQEKPVKAGEVIIKEGDEEADFFYVVDIGTYDIHIGGKKKKTYIDEGSFGELALLYNTPRAATITASTDGTLWALDRGTFRRIVLKSAFKKRQVYEEFINAVPILGSLEPYERMKVCDALKSVKFGKDDVIIKRGDIADNMYFVEKGEVKVLRTNEEGKTKEVSRIGRGGYFGELGLISKNPRVADVVSLENTTCAALDLEAFERLLGPCVDVMKRNMASYDDDMHRAFNKGII